LNHKFVFWLINNDEILTNTLCTISKKAIDICKRWLSRIRIRDFLVSKSVNITYAISQVFKSFKEDSRRPNFILFVHNTISGTSLIGFYSHIFEVFHLWVFFELTYRSELSSTILNFFCRTHSKALCFVRDGINIRLSFNFVKVINIFVYPVLDYLTSQGSCSYGVWSLQR